MEIENCKLKISPRCAAPGFTIIEVLITTFIIGTVVTGVFGLFVLSLRSAQEGERRVVAIALANERAEMIRNLPYQAVGTVGGIPAGSIPPSETIVRDLTSFTVGTDIRYIDDTFDGEVTSDPPDLINTDYKQARIEVAWGQSRSKPIVLLLTIAPAGLEGGDATGTLDFQALSASGAGVAGATVTVVNDTTDPTIDLTTETNDNGRLILPGLPISSGTYAISVTKSGFTSEQTYTQTPTFIPDADHAHLSMLEGQVTPKTFLIDLESELSLQTQDDDEKKLGHIAYGLQGTKSIGINDQNEPVLYVDRTGQTNGAGKDTQNSLTWDAYDLTIDGIATGYDIKETNFILPVTIDPDTDLALTATLVPHTDISLHVSVLSPDSQPVDNATVTLAHDPYNATQGTGVVGQVLFSDLPENTDYTLTIDAPGYEPYTDTVPVANTTRLHATLTPTNP